MILSLNPAVQLPDQTNIKCVHELECDSLPKIQEEALEWIKKNTNFLDDKVSIGFWKTINDHDMVKSCPSLMKYIRSIKIPIREVTIGLLTESMTSGFSLHNGSPPYNFKINFPILNTEDVWTEWYKIPPEDCPKFGTRINEHTGAEMYAFEKIHDQVQDLYPCLTRYNMHKCPIIFNSYIPHRVMPGPGAKYPRIMLATMPIKDPIELMTINKDNA